MQVSVAKLVRVSRRPADELFWGKRAVNRFDDDLPDAGRRFGVCYAGDCLETSFAESVIHDSALYQGGRFLVPSADLRTRHLVYFQHATRKRLRLADLTGIPLKALGLSNDLSATGVHALSRAWARAVHESDPKWDGIRDVSRQRNDAYAYALFERSGLTKASTRPLEGAELDALCDLFNVLEL